MKIKISEARTVATKVPKKIFPIGIGTWGIGGFAERDPENDDKKQIEALTYTLEKGANYIDTVTMYGGGYSLKLINKALRGLNWSKLFINSKITGTIEKPKDIQNQTERYLKELGLDYLDSIMLHAPWRAEIGLERTFEEMARMVEMQKVRYLSVSNCIPEQLDLFRKVTGIPLFANEIDYDFEVRIHDEIGTVKNCITNGTRVICFQPLRRSETAKQNYPILVEMSKKYGKTQNQIILNWLTHKDLFLPIVKSSTKSHIDENLRSIGWEMEPEDYKKIEDFRIDFKFPKPDLEVTGVGVRVSNYSLYLTENLK